MKVGEPDRHQSQALVERQNQTIGRALFHWQVAQELLTGQPDTAWKDDLPSVITEMPCQTCSLARQTGVGRITSRNWPKQRPDFTRSEGQKSIVRTPFDAQFR